MSTSVTTKIMSIKEMIDNAFGDENKNVVNFKLMQTVLYIIGRQLRVLERRVEVEVGYSYDFSSSESNISITEVKMHAKLPKKVKTAVKERVKVSEPKTKPETTKKPEVKETAQVTTAKVKSSSDIQLKHKAPTIKPGTASATSISDLTVPKTILEKLEEQREAELRVIPQRSNSRVEGNKEPTPIESLDSVNKEELQKEKLLIVERMKEKPGTRSTSQRLSVVTQDQFEELVKEVRQLQSRLQPVGTADFPENAQLMNELRKSASLTDAMAALQLSARLEAAEKALSKMTSLVTDLATRTADKSYGQKEPSVTAHVLSEKSKLALKQKAEAEKKAQKGRIRIERPKVNSDKKDWVLYEQYDSEMDLLYNLITKIVDDISSKTEKDIKVAVDIATRVEKKLDVALSLGPRMEDLEALVAQYIEQITVLDTGLSSQLTDHQEQLTQMQHDLETGMENMAEALGKETTDNAAIAELNSHFNSLQHDLDHMFSLQRDLKDSQDMLASDLQIILRDIELLREIKADRDEVVDAMRDKAGLGALNGLVTQVQFCAVREDLENRIRSAYTKFNNQENVWQKVINEFTKLLDEKVDTGYVLMLREDIANHIKALNNDLKRMSELVGEPKAVAVSRKLFRDTECLSCCVPAKMDTTFEPVQKLPGLPIRPPAIGAEATKDSDDLQDRGDGACYPGFPVPHPIDLRSHICRRYCGGSHTIMSSVAAARAPPELIVTPRKRVTTAIGTDGKLYKVDELLEKRPCIPCNQPSKQPSTPETRKEVNDDVTLPEDFGSAMMPWMRASTGIDVTCGIQLPSEGLTGAGISSGMGVSTTANVTAQSMETPPPPTYFD